MSSNLVTIKSKHEFDPLPGLAGLPGKLVFAFLKVEDLENIKRVSKRCIPNAEFIERIQFVTQFPTKYLWLVGGSVEALKKLPLLVFGRPKPYKREYPDHFVAWIRVNANSWRIHIYRREITADRTSRHLLIYQFISPEKLKKREARLPDDPSSFALDSPEQESPEIPLKIKELVPFISSWIIDGPRCSREKSCCTCICCGHTWLSKPWTCWYQIGFFCGCTFPLTVEQDFVRRHTRTYATFHPGENPGITFSKDGVPYIPMQKSERKG